MLEHLSFNEHDGAPKFTKNCTIEGIEFTIKSLADTNIWLSIKERCW